MGYPAEHEPVQADAVRSGHFFVDPGAAPRTVAMQQAPLPFWLAAAPLRRRERLF
jgi:hypothetical protein